MAPKILTRYYLSKPEIALNKSKVALYIYSVGILIKVSDSLFLYMENAVKAQAADSDTLCAFAGHR